jgi:hypothetical protein
VYELHFSCQGAEFGGLENPPLLAGGTRAELSQLASSVVPAPPDLPIFGSLSGAKHTGTLAS